MATKSTSFQEDRPAGKPYETPRLEVYGDIREITDAVGMMGMRDGAMGMGMNRTG